MIFTLNEEVHIRRCLESVGWCDDLIVVDSGSVDRTEVICNEYNVRFFQHEFMGFGDQRNWALQNASPRYPWVLILDADEYLDSPLEQEIREIIPFVCKEISAFRIKRRFFFWGKWLRRSASYPVPLVRLIRLGKVYYINRGHSETQTVEGKILDLENDLIDENLKDLGEWFGRQNRYSTQEAEYELSVENQPLRLKEIFSGDPLSRRNVFKRVAARLPARPLCYFLYSYFFRGGFLEGKAGLVFCLMRSIYEGMIVLKKINLKRKRQALPQKL